METRASYMMVGGFTLLIVVGALLFVLWTAKSTKGEMRTYEIVFGQSVSGLSVGGAVLLEGVRVGQVSRIKVSPQDPGQVVVHIQVAADAPIRKNSQATLEPQGVTGMSAVAISGGTADSPLLAESGEAIARIPAVPSKLHQIMNSVPAILSSIDTLITRANELLAPDNMRAVDELLDSINEIASALAANKESISKGVVGFGDAAQSFAASSKEFDQLVKNSQAMVKDFRAAAGDVSKAAKNLDSTMASVGPGLSRFSRESSDELHRLLVEARRFLGSLAKLTQKFESDPRRFLLGNPVPEFSAK